MQEKYVLTDRRQSHVEVSKMLEAAGFGSKKRSPRGITKPAHRKSVAKKKSKNQRQARRKNRS